MKVIEEGHKYLLDVYDGKKGDTLEVDFMKREGEGYPFNVGTHSGTNCQENLRMLIDRVKYLNAQTVAMIGMPESYDLEILEHLRFALFLFEARAAERHGLKAYFKPETIEARPHCLICGHILCHGHEEKKGIKK